MKLRKISVEELRELYQRELCFDFPPEELKPLSSMERLMADGRYDPMVMEDQGEALGYALVWLDCDRRYALLDHLGVLRGKRNGGLGSELLTLLGEHYPELFGEAEAPDSGDPEEDQLRARRLGFMREMASGAELRVRDVRDALPGAIPRVRRKMTILSCKNTERYIRIFQQSADAALYPAAAGKG